MDSAYSRTQRNRRESLAMKVCGFLAVCACTVLMFLAVTGGIA